MTHRRARRVAVLPLAVLAVLTGCDDGVAAPDPGPPPSVSTSSALPDVHEHDGETLYPKGLQQIRDAFVDDPTVAEVRVYAGGDDRDHGVSDCFPFAVAVVREQTDDQVTISVGTYSPSRSTPDDLACPAKAVDAFELTLVLDEPLGDRRLWTETAYGPSERVRVHRADQLPEPVPVPDGFVGGELRLGTLGLAARYWTRPDGHSLHLAQLHPGATFDDAEALDLQAAVHGRRAVVTRPDGRDHELCVRWHEGGYVIQLCWLMLPEEGSGRDEGPPPPDVEALLAVAESMPPVVARTD